MTVQELLAKLEGVDPSLPVVHVDGDLLDSAEVSTYSAADGDHPCVILDFAE